MINSVTNQLDRVNISRDIELENIGINALNLDGLISGQVYKKPEDFIVNEIISTMDYVDTKAPIKRNNKKARFIHASLIKKGISTFEACNQLAQANKLDYKKVTYYGLKDTNGLSSQRICFENHDLKKTKFVKFFLNKIAFENWCIETNTHMGNKFKIRVRCTKKNPTTKECMKKFIANTQNGLPNFYGPQRFGVRQNGHLLGKFLLKQDYEAFLFEFLTQSKNESVDVSNIRLELKNNFGDWKKCLLIAKTESRLANEIELLNYLSLGNSYLNAIQKVKIASFFPHAYSSFIFNQTLSNYLNNHVENIQLEKIGYDTKLNQTTQKLFNNTLKREGISIKEFKHPCPNFRVKSHPRPVLFFPKKFKYKFSVTDLMLEFTLGAGEYASVLLGFLVKGAFWKLE